jgi:hypothetical protein
VPQFVIGTFSLAATIAKSLHGNVKADFVPVFETIRHCLGGVVHFHFNSFNLMLLNAFGQGLSGKAHDT